MESLSRLRTYQVTPGIFYGKLYIFNSSALAEGQTCSNPPLVINVYEMLTYLIPTDVLR